MDFRFLNNLIKVGVKPQNVIDIGAYHGEWTIEFLSKFPESNILMIEAQAAKMKRLEGISHKHENVKCYEAVISSIDGETVLMGTGFISALAPTVSADSPVWVSPITIEVNGDYTNPEVVTLGA